MPILLAALLAAAVNTEPDVLAYRPGDLAVTVRGAPWVISTGSGTGSCSNPPVPGNRGIYQCWDAEGDGAVVDAEAGCLEVSGSGYCGPASQRAGSDARFALVCNSGEVFMLASGFARMSCWKRGDPQFAEATCGDGVTLAASRHYAVAACERGCIETGGAGGCSVIEGAVETRPDRVIRVLREYPGDPDDEE